MPLRSHVGRGTNHSPSLLQISRAKLEKMRSEIGRMDGRGAMNINRRKLSSVEHRLDKMSVRLNQAVRPTSHPRCQSYHAPHTVRPTHS